GVVPEIKLCGERHMQRLRNSKMNMSRSRQPGVFLQPGKMWWDWVSPRHDGFKLIIALLIAQHHSSQVEVHVFGKVARLIGFIQPGVVRLPDFNQCVWQAATAVGTVYLARYNKPFAGFVRPSQCGLKRRAEAIVRPNYLTLCQPTGFCSGSEGSRRKGSAE